MNIADAKWRSSRKVEQGEVMKLEAVRQKVGAHKGFIFTNVGFTDGALAADEDAGIALHTVKPSFDYPPPRRVPRRFPACVSGVHAGTGIARS